MATEVGFVLRVATLEVRSREGVKRGGDYWGVVLAFLLLVGFAVWRSF